mmetsp:Transcript_5636/g.10587  ORF Transcript_5636/g.10587 Transcript_5636/m.10587 type:complete len:354 (-) Transcript_5636:1059-2120(-)
MGGMPTTCESQTTVTRSDLRPDSLSKKASGDCLRQSRSSTEAASQSLVKSTMVTLTDFSESERAQIDATNSATCSSGLKYRLGASNGGQHLPGRCMPTASMGSSSRTSASSPGREGPDSYAKARAPRSPRVPIRRASLTLYAAPSCPDGGLTGRPLTSTQGGPSGLANDSMAARKFIGWNGNVRTASRVAASNASASFRSWTRILRRSCRRMAWALSSMSTRATGTAGRGATTTLRAFAKTSVFTSVYSAMSFLPRSPDLPIPELLTPPKGAFLMNSQCRLTHTVPALSWRASMLAVSISLLQIEAPSPKVVALARRIASASSLKGIKGTTGPNCSSSTSRVPSMMPTTIVGK